MIDGNVFMQANSCKQLLRCRYSREEERAITAEAGPRRGDVRIMDCVRFFQLGGATVTLLTVSFTETDRWSHSWHPGERIGMQSASKLVLPFCVSKGDGCLPVCRLCADCHQLSWQDDRNLALAADSEVLNIWTTRKLLHQAAGQQQ